jgi:hypothetical protein
VFYHTYNISLSHSSTRSESSAKKKNLNKKNQQQIMPSLSAITIFAFGATSFLAGIHSLLFPEQNARSLNIPASAPRAPLSGNALAAIAMGLYYTLAAWQENASFFKLTVPMRLLTTVVFWRHGGTWKTVAAWEGAGSMLTLIALLVDGSLWRL